MRRIKQERHEEQGKVAPLEKKTHPPTEQQREDVVEARRQWAAAQLNLDPDRVVFVDETWGAAAIEAVGAEVRYLPPYSPDLNPIELAFSKFKKLLRDDAQRTTEKLWQLCGQALDLFTQNDCHNYIAHC